MKRIALSLLFFTLCLCLLPGRAALAASPGWELLPEGWVYHEEDGSRRTGWLSWQGDWYYLDEQGVMQTGWVWSSPDWYWCAPSGRMAPNAGIDGWYIGKNGRMAGRAAPLGEADIAAVTAAAQWDGKPLGLYFEDLASGQSLLLGGEERYYLASVLKAPYCMWVYTLADAGKADLSQTVRYDASMRHGGSGVVKDFASGTEIPVADLLEYAIRYSDNTAIDLLLSRFPFADFKEFIVKEAGLTCPEGMETFSRTTLPLKDIAAMTKRVAAYLYSGAAHADALREDLLSTDYRCILAENNEIAQKYGYWEGWFHTTALVYGNRPYLLCICTAPGSGIADTMPFYQVYYAVEMALR